MKVVSFGVLLSAVAKSGTGTYNGELSGEYPITWYKREGDVVVEGEALADIETEKVLLEITAPASGRLASLFTEKEWSTNGETVGTPYGAILAPALGEIEAGCLDSLESPVELWENEGGNGRIRMTPLARKMAGETGVNMATLQPTGIGGRICAEDVRNARGETSEIRAVPAARALVREKGIDLAGISGSGDGGLILYKDVQNAVALKEYLEPVAEMTEELRVRTQAQENEPKDMRIGPPGEDLGKMIGRPKEREVLRALTKEEVNTNHSSFRRKEIARLLERSWREIPHAGDKTKPVDITDLVSFHKRAAKVWLAATGIKLRYDSYLAYLAVKLLQGPRFSILNGYWDEDAGGKVLKPHINIGITVTVSDKKDPQEDYLVIPVIHHAEELDFPSFAKRAHELVESALLGKLSVGDTRGLTVTFNNTGVLGGTDPSSILPYVMEAGG
ncbi:MAG: E3 binding domain-containing protein, partial [Candidatus Liptonbacteria bacterium]|nr:E3 binding domain-containing protein [Candidatus Liptonbacteria bacterium]